MKFILFLMFFVTPPGPSDTAPEDRVWSLQSTSAMEFKSQLACNSTGTAITESLVKTYTVTVRAWCFCESDNPAAPCPETPTVSPNDRNKFMMYQLQLDQLKKKSPRGFGMQRLEPPPGK